MSYRKVTMNVPLKVAIVLSGQSQRTIAQRTGIGEVRLSAIVHERKVATGAERKVLSRVLEWPVGGLFPAPRERRSGRLIRRVS